MLTTRPAAMDAEGGKVRAVRQRVLAYLMVSIDYLVQV